MTADTRPSGDEIFVGEMGETSEGFDVRPSGASTEPPAYGSEPRVDPVDTMAEVLDAIMPALIDIDPDWQSRWSTAASVIEALRERGYDVVRADVPDAELARAVRWFLANGMTVVRRKDWEAAWARASTEAFLLDCAGHLAKYGCNVYHADEPCRWQRARQEQADVDRLLRELVEEVGRWPIRGTEQMPMGAWIRARNWLSRSASRSGEPDAPG